jgi:phage gp16-like protein
MAKSASGTKKPDARKSQLAQIHIAKKDRRLDDETYRAMLFTLARVRSSAELDHAGRAKVLEHLKKCGWKPKAGAFKTAAPKNSPASKTALISKVGALLTVLDKPWEYADGMAKKMFNVEKIIWLTPQKLHKLVAALEYAKAREAKKNEAAE